MATIAPPGKPLPEKQPLWIVDLGSRPYEETRELQKRLVLARMEGRIPDVLLLLEHEPVFTMGRHGRWENLLLSRQSLSRTDIRCVSTERGGDVTYHGPGQLVGYPILRVAGGGRKVKALVTAFEEVLLRTLARFGLQGRRDPRDPGIWVGQAKIGSIGLAVQHRVSFHGFSLNVDMDLTPFSWINTCGRKGLLLTSLRELLGRKVPVQNVKRIVVSQFAHTMAYRPALPDKDQGKEAAALGLPPPARVGNGVDDSPAWIEPEDGSNA